MVQIDAQGQTDTGEPQEPNTDIDPTGRFQRECDEREKALKKLHAALADLEVERKAYNEAKARLGTVEKRYQEAADKVRQRCRTLDKLMSTIPREGAEASE